MPCPARLVVVGVWLAAAGPVLAAQAATPAAGGNPGAAAQEPEGERSTDGFFTTRERAWEVRAGYFVSIESFRHIQVAILEVARAWRFSDGLELQLRGGLFHANGDRTDVPPGLSPDSTATGISAGGGLRWDPLVRGGVHLFLDVSVEIVVTPGQAFPSGGSGINGFLRGGPGVSYDLSRRFTVEVIYQVAHVSNASGGGPQNPGWSGQGGCLSIRYRG